MEQKETNSKTWKREVAVALFLALGVLVYNDKTEMVELLVWPVTVFAVGAFGLDATAKQLQSVIGRK